jgi:6,7-dimethyl-8-ribityllumazine synthase
MVNLGLVVAEFNASVTERMAEAAADAAVDRGVEIGETVRVPGVYDSPLAADRLARREEIDAVAVVGAVVTGDRGVAPVGRDRSGHAGHVRRHRAGTERR